jgi:glucose/arabinose dehydrogenase
MGAAGLGLSQAIDIQIELVASGLSSPVAITNAGDNRLFIAERGGQIRILTFDAQGQATLLPAPFLDVGILVLAGGERGLLSTAFHPDYASNGFFYVDYTCLASASAACQTDGDTNIVRYSVSANPNAANVGSAVVLAAIPQDFSNHNCGQLQFEPFPIPEDNRTLLYISTGDGGSGNDPNNRAQDLNSLLGKMLRVDVDNIDPGSPLPKYHIPNDNPFGTEIWALGLRNPWRFSFDRQTGDMFIGDVGQNAREELDFQPSRSTGGENYGWRMCEATRQNFDAEAPATCEDGTGGLAPPVLEYPHDDGCSITGGYIYRGSEFDL